MTRQLLILYGVVFCTAAFGQTTGPGIGAASNTPFASSKLLQMDQKIIPTRTNAPFKIEIPKDLSEDKTKATMELIKKLHETCPQCSNGGTIGGGDLVVGGNSQGASTNLFGKALSGDIPDPSEYIQVKKSTYNELKRKADNYDKLFATPK